MPETKSNLSKSQAHLVELMQRVNFGQIEGLVVKNGEPVFEPAPLVVRRFKFGSKNGPRAEASKGNFTLKTEVLDLLAQLQALDDGVIQCLEVQRGLPFRMSVREDLA